MDQISNMLITIKNGGQTGKELVHVPYSEFKNSIVSVLLSHGYIKSYAKKKRKKGDVIEIGLVYKENAPRIADIKRVSKSSRRVYFGVKDIRPVQHGHGALILSTPKGILTGEEAQKELVGGEVLFEIW